MQSDYLIGEVKMRNQIWRRGFVDRKVVFLAIAIAITSLAVTWTFDTDCAFSDEPAFIRADEPLDDGDEAFIKELKRSADEISARELNECHLAMLGRMLLASPNVLQLKLRYKGIISTDEGNHVITHPMSAILIRGGQRLHGSIGSPLEWSVSSEKNSLVIFSMSITVRKTDRTRMRRSRKNGTTSAACQSSISSNGWKRGRPN
jgi:hypothetical protein